MWAPAPACKSHVVAERADVRAGIALHAEQDKSSLGIEDLEFLDLADAQGALDRALPRRALVQPPGELFCQFQDPFPVNVVMQPHQADILLVVLEQQGGKADGVAEHDEEDTGYLRVERAGMPHLAPEHLPHPCSHFVTGGALRFVDNDNPGPVPEVDRSGFHGFTGHCPCSSRAGKVRIERTECSFQRPVAHDSGICPARAHGLGSDLPDCHYQQARARRPDRLLKGHGTGKEDRTGTGKIEFVSGRFKTVAPELPRDTPRHSNRVNESGVRHIRPRDADPFAPDPVPEIRHEVPGIETGQDLAVDVMLAEFLCGLRPDGNHAGEPAHAGCDDLCREGAGEEDAVELPRSAASTNSVIVSSRIAERRGWTL